MLTKITKIDRSSPETVEIHCHDVSEEVQEIISFVKSRQGQLGGVIDGRRYEISVSEVFYIEAVDNKCFIYTKSDVYEAKKKLYELEELLEKKHFIRVSKSMLLNLMKIDSIKPALNGRFTAVLSSGEQIIISRKYVPVLKQALKGES